MQTGSVAQWLGVPFAADPVGRLRFAPPRKRSAWRPRVLDAASFPPACPQKLGDPRIDVMDERCLKLCVFAPANATTDRSEGLLPTAVCP